MNGYHANDGGTVELMAKRFCEAGYGVLAVKMVMLKNKVLQREGALSNWSDLVRRYVVCWRRHVDNTW